MKYKLIAVDLDDSLLDSDLRISDRNKKALTRAIEQGVLVTIATGRMFRSAVVYAKELELDIPIITYQGSLIKNALSNDVLYNQPLSLDKCQKIISICQSMGLHLQIYVGDEYYFQEDNRYSAMYHKNIGVPGKSVGPLDKFSFNPPNKLLIIDEPERIANLREKFSKVLGEEIEINISKPQYLEFTHRDATKGKALEYLATLKNISSDEIISIGDSYNDISMIRYAGLGVAMENAPKDVKSHAVYITGSNDDDGVAKVIEKFILKGG